MKGPNKGIVKVAGIWELGWNTPIKEHDLWEMVMRDFEVDEFYMTPVSGIDSQFVHEKQSLEEIIKENPDLTVVYVDENAKTTLNDFVHPKNVLYIPGKTTNSPYISMAREGDIAVKFETKWDHTTSGLLWAHQAMSIILYDRLRKSWQ